MHIFSFSPFGYEGSLVSVEVDLRRGIPAVDVVGLADGAVRESKERMKVAICNSGFEFPSERVLISLSPADLKKEGAGFDLAIALAVLEAESTEEKRRSGDVLVMGELELSGNIRAVRGVHAAASTAAAAGIQQCIVPAANGEEAREVAGMRVFAADNLTEAFRALPRPDFFTDGSSENSAFVPEGCCETDGILFPPPDSNYEFADITGQNFLIRGLQIAAAGGHHVITYGPPGCGKTIACRRFSALLPLLTVEEAHPVTRIYSLAGILSPDEPLIRIPPFRMPHQTATIEGMCGGGARCRPGEISLAHNGVLFLDEAAEFRTSVLQMLRVPIESGMITLSRAGRSTVYPAVFQLLLATNPCPCGNYGSKNKICLCSARAVELYWKKFSAPLLDRIDIRIHIDTISTDDSDKSLSGMSTADLRVRIAHAVSIQRGRQGKRNARLQPGEMVGICNTSRSARHILDIAAKQYGLSPRAVAGCLKVSRTIADMDNSDTILESHMEEAVQYRRSDGVADMCS